MNKYIKYLFIVLFVTISFVSNAQTPITIIEKKLLDSVALKISYKTCVLMETDSFILFTPSKYFIEPFALWIKNHPELIDDKILYTALTTDTEKRLIKANRIAAEYNLSKRMLPQIAECLRIGRCIIYNKTTQQLEKKITIEGYIVNNLGEERYIVNGSLLFKVSD